MRVVHYTLGLFPNRTGGLNRYATDLMMEQSKEHEVTVIKPGGWNPFSGKCSILKRRDKNGLKCYDLVNALPQPLLYGIKKPGDFMGNPISRISFDKFYNEVKPEVFHIHSLMGLSEQVLHFFKDKGVKIVFTSHDYFGICPKVNLINANGDLCDGPSPERCSVCNTDSKNTLYLRLRSCRMAFIIRDITRWLKNSKNS